nr:hypothetical protein [Tanacetum cinerariifolium]
MGVHRSGCGEDGRLGEKNGLEIVPELDSLINGASMIIWIWRIDLVCFVVFSELQVHIHRIFLDGYGVLVVRTSSTSRVTRAKTSTSKDDVPFLTVSDDDEVKLLDLHDHCYARQAVVDNAVKRRSCELLEVIEKLRGEVVLFYNGLDVPTRQILDSRGAIPSKTDAYAKVAIQEIVEYFQKWHNGTSKTRSTKTSNGLAAIQAQLNNLGREIKKVNEKVYVAQVGCKQCKGPHYTKDFPLKEEGKTLEEAYNT